MTAATAVDLVQRIEHLAHELQQDTTPVDRARWESFDQTTYRFVVTLSRTRHLGPGRVTLDTKPLLALLKDYPRPLAAVGDDREYSPKMAARLLGTSEEYIRVRIERGTLPSRRDGTQRLIPAKRSGCATMCFASIDDPHPLARTACAIGALTDMLVSRDLDPHRPEIGAGPTLALAHAVLDVAYKAARHSVAASDPTDALRPLEVARFAQRALARIALTSQNSPLPRVVSPPPARTGGGTNDRLDAAVHAWTRAAWTELNHSAPSIQTIRNVTDQSIHLLAALDTVAAHSWRNPGERQLDRSLLRDTAIALGTASRGWGPATTGTPPSHHYVDAARDLHAVLQQLVSTRAERNRHIRDDAPPTAYGHGSPRPPASPAILQG